MKPFERLTDTRSRAEREATPASELLYRLLCEEAASRRQRSLAYRLDQAKLPWPWMLDTSAFERQSGVNKAQIKGLAGLEFLRRPEKPDLRSDCCAELASTATAAVSIVLRLYSTNSTLHWPTGPPRERSNG
jgi:IstB-like ATP binding protein